MSRRDQQTRPRVLILGAGFGGLELATSLSEALGDGVAVTLIDKSDAFVFGYSKLDVMFGRLTADAVRLPYRGLRQARRQPQARDRHRDRSRRPAASRPTPAPMTPTSWSIALGADYDVSSDARGHARRQRVLLGRGRGHCATCCRRSGGATR